MFPDFMRLVDDHLYLIDKTEEPYLDPSVFRAIVNISPSTPNSHTAVAYHRIPDVSRDTPRLDGYEEASAFIQQHVSQHNTVAVHCNAGYQRSLPFLAWHLHRTRHIPIKDAVIQCMGPVVGQELADPIQHLLDARH